MSLEADVIPEGAISPSELPEKVLIRATVSFKDNPNKRKGQEDSDLRVDCTLVKDRNRDKYTMYPYITHSTSDWTLRYRRILCVWNYEELS